MDDSPQPESVLRLRSLAESRGLTGLRADLAEIVDDLEPGERPLVPTRLLEALDRFLDSYGPAGPGERPERGEGPAAG